MFFIYIFLERKKISEDLQEKPNNFDLDLKLGSTSFFSLDKSEYCWKKD